MGLVKTRRLAAMQKHLCAVVLKTSAQGFLPASSSPLRGTSHIRISDVPRNGCEQWSCEEVARLLDL